MQSSVTSRKPPTITHEDRVKGGHASAAVQVRDGNGRFNGRPDKQSKPTAGNVGRPPDAQNN